MIFFFVQIASSIVPCPRNSTTSDFEQCLLDLLTTLKPYLAAGDLGDGFLIRRIEPLYIDMLPIDSVELKINMTNVYSTGGSSLKFTSVKYGNLLNEMTNSSNFFFEIILYYK